MYSKFSSYFFFLKPESVVYISRDLSAQFPPSEEGEVNAPGCVTTFSCRVICKPLLFSYGTSNGAGAAAPQPPGLGAEFPRLPVCRSSRCSKATMGSSCRLWPRAVLSQHEQAQGRFPPPRWCRSKTSSVWHVVPRQLSHSPAKVLSRALPTPCKRRCHLQRRSWLQS